MTDQYDISSSEIKLKVIPLLTQEERHQLLVKWNDTKANFPHNKCIHQLFEEQVEKTPNDVAVVFEDKQLTYAELNALSNQWAHYLRNLDIKADTLVAICMERSLEMLIGLLGILKAGGAYVPLDPDHPKERLSYMLEDTKVTLLLTQKKLIDKLPRRTPRLVFLNSDWGGISHYPTSNLANTTLPEHLAYCIYTSGSTGQPKAVMNAHRAIINRLFWIQAKYALDTSDAVLQKTPFSFDISVWEFFWPLIAGARLVIALPMGHKDPAYLADAITKFKITTVHFVPSMLQIFISFANNKDDFKSLRRVLCSGEALSYSLRTKFFKHFPGVELHNLYGPTEAAVEVTHWNCKIKRFDNKVPIGRPISNTQIYLLNAWMQPVPKGVVGELYIGGVQLARGYLNRSDLTAEQFIPNPFGEPGSRMYRTGDLARYLCDGNIEFIGRVDNQVKIRGYRIELGEIEEALLRCENVKEVVVVAHNNGSGDGRLIAYIVKESTSDLTVNDLRTKLQEKLPNYMLPSIWAFLDALPLTPNGKIDRKALPVQDDIQPMETGVTYIGPRNHVEQVFANIWEYMLKVKPVGIYDNFFSLGGHSLLAVKLMQEINNCTKFRVTLSDCMFSKTLSDLARCAKVAISDDDILFPKGTSIVTLRNLPSKTNRVLVFFHSFSGFLSVYGNLVKNLPEDDFPVILGVAPPLRKFPEIRAELSTIEALGELYGKWLLNFSKDHQLVLSGFCMGAAFALEAARYLREQHTVSAKVVAISPISTYSVYNQTTTARSRVLGTWYKYARSLVSALNTEHVLNQPRFWAMGRISRIRFLLSYRDSTMKNSAKYVLEEKEMYDHFKYIQWLLNNGVDYKMRPFSGNVTNIVLKEHSSEKVERDLDSHTHVFLEFAHTGALSNLNTVSYITDTFRTVVH